MSSAAEDDREEIKSKKIDLILPTVGKLFFEQKPELLLCKPQLMPLKSITLEKLEKMQKEAEEELKKNRAKTAVPKEE